MKKLLFTILSLFILSCRGDDNESSDDNAGTTMNPDLVGAWVGTVGDIPTNTSVQTLVFNADGTGSLTMAFVLTGETFVGILDWYSDATTIYGTLDGELDEIGYVFSGDNNMLQLTFPDGVESDYVRLD